MMLRSLSAALLLVGLACPANGELQDNESSPVAIEASAVAISIGGFEVAAQQIEIRSAGAAEAMLPFACTLRGIATIKSGEFTATADNIAVRADDGRQQIILNGKGRLMDKGLQLEAEASDVIIVPGDRLILKAKENQKARLLIGSDTPAAIESEMIEYVFGTGTVVTGDGTKVQLGIKSTATSAYGVPADYINPNHAESKAVFERSVQTLPQKASRYQPPSNNNDQ